MREAKFRGIRIDNNEWSCGDLVINRPTDSYRIVENFALVCDPIEYKGSELVGCSGEFHDVHKKTVGQFIRTDQYNAEIYEGDLFMNGDSIRIIEIHGGNTHAITPKRTESILLSFIIKSNPKNKVVGNIHQNPELLES